MKELGAALAIGIIVVAAISIIAQLDPPKAGAQIVQQHGTVILVAEMDDVSVYEVRRIVGVPCYLAVAKPRSETSGGAASVSLACP